MLLYLLIVLGGVVAFEAIFYITDFCSFVFEYCEEDAVRLSFDQFIIFYKSAPDKWRLKEDYVKYIKRRNEEGLFDKSEPVFFSSYRSLAKYRKWKEKNEKAQMEQEKSRKTLSLSKCWSEDIDKAYQNAIKDVQSMFYENFAAAERQKQALKVLMREHGVDKIASYSIEPLDKSIHVQDDHCITWRILDR